MVCIIRKKETREEVEAKILSPVLSNRLFVIVQQREISTIDEKGV